MSENQIDREKVYTYVERHHGPVTPSTNGFYEAVCPICGRRKFYFNPNYLTGKCYRGCFNGFMIDLIMLFHQISYFEARELVDSMEPSAFRLPAAINRATRNSRVSLPVGYHGILEGNGSLAQRARKYLEDRNFDLNYLDRIGVGYCDEEGPDPKESYLGRIIIPFKHEGSLNYFIGRSFIDDFNRYKNPEKSKCGTGKSEVIFNEEALYIEPTIYLTEGWSCAATIGRAGISQQGSTPSVIQRNLILKCPVKEVVIVPDAEFYLQGLQTAKYFLPHKKVRVVNMDQFLLDGIGKDVNAVGIENFRDQESRTDYMTTQILYHELKRYA